MSYHRDFLELARVFEMYGRSETKLDNQFIEYATKKIYHVLTGKDDLVVHCSDEMGANRADAGKGSITFYTRVIDYDNSRVLNQSNPNYILNYNLKTLYTICHEVTHLFQLADQISPQLRLLYFDTNLARASDENTYRLNHNLYPVETHADLFGAFLVSEIVSQTNFSDRFKSSVNRKFYRDATNRYLVNGAVVAPTDRFYDLVSSRANFNVNHMSFQDRLLNCFSISSSEYSKLNRMVSEATHHDTPASFFQNTSK